MAWIGTIGIERDITQANPRRCGTHGKGTMIISERIRTSNLLQCKFDEEMEAVATTGLYPPTGITQVGSDIDTKYGLLQLAARAASPPTAGAAMSRASYPQIDSQQQLIYRGLNNARTALYGQVMSYGGTTRPYESPHMLKRDELGKKILLRNS